jgi:hypothetical protein
MESSGLAAYYMCVWQEQKRKETERLAFTSTSALNLVQYAQDTIPDCTVPSVALNIHIWKWTIAVVATVVIRPHAIR